MVIGLVGALVLTHLVGQAWAAERPHRRGNRGGHVAIGSAWIIDSTAVALTFIGGKPVTNPRASCQRDYDVVVREEAAVVSVGVIENPDERVASELCTLMGYRRSGVALLQAPLSGRTVVDAATGTAVPLARRSVLFRVPYLLDPSARTVIGP